MVRTFLLTNLERDKSAFKWRVNIGKFLFLSRI